MTIKSKDITNKWKNSGLREPPLPPGLWESPHRGVTYKNYPIPALYTTKPERQSSLEIMWLWSTWRPRNWLRCHRLGWWGNHQLGSQRNLLGSHPLGCQQGLPGSHTLRNWPNFTGGCKTSVSWTLLARKLFTDHHIIGAKRKAMEPRIGAPFCMQCPSSTFYWQELTCQLATKKCLQVPALISQVRGKKMN